MKKVTRSVANKICRKWLSGEYTIALLAEEFKMPWRKVWNIVVSRRWI